MSTSLEFYRSHRASSTATLDDAWILERYVSALHGWIRHKGMVIVPTTLHHLIGYVEWYIQRFPLQTYAFRVVHYHTGNSIPFELL